MNLFLYFEIFSTLAILFFIVSFLTRREYRIYVVILNLLFLGSLYFFMVSLVGLPKPIGYGIPFFTHEKFTANNLPLIVDGYISDKFIFLMVEENSQVKLYQYPYTEAFYKELMKAYKERNSWGFTFEPTDTLYGAGTQPNVPMGQFEHNHGQEKPPSDEEGGKTYEIK